MFLKGTLKIVLISDPQTLDVPHNGFIIHRRASLTFRRERIACTVVLISDGKFWRRKIFGKSVHKWVEFSSGSTTYQIVFLGESCNVSEYTCFYMPFKRIILGNWAKWCTGKYFYRLMRYMSSLSIALLLFYTHKIRCGIMVNFHTGILDTY